MIFLPLAIVALASGAAVTAVKKPKAQMTPERSVIFETAMNSVEDPNKLRALAAVYAKQGLKTQADALNKRADLREMPADVKAQRKQIFRQGMSSQNPQAVMNLASAFDAQGASGAAASLRQYATQLNASQQAATTANATPSATVATTTPNTTS